MKAGFIFILSLLTSSFALASTTFSYTFNNSATYERCTATGSKGGTNRTCGRVSCSQHSPEEAPLDCFSKGYIEIVNQEQFKKEKEATLVRIQELENLLLQYRQDLARNQRDVMETMIRDPQFRSELLKQLKSDSRR